MGERRRRERRDTGSNERAQNARTPGQRLSQSLAVSEGEVAARQILGFSLHHPLQCLEVRRAYRSLSLTKHPDKADKNGLTKEEAEEQFRQLTEAYELLSRFCEEVFSQTGDQVRS